MMKNNDNPSNTMSSNKSNDSDKGRGKNKSNAVDHDYSFMDSSDLEMLYNHGHLISNTNGGTGARPLTNNIAGTRSSAPSPGVPPAAESIDAQSDGDKKPSAISHADDGGTEGNGGAAAATTSHPPPPSRDHTALQKFSPKTAAFIGAHSASMDDDHEQRYQRKMAEQAGKKRAASIVGVTSMYTPGQNSRFEERLRCKMDEGRRNSQASVSSSTSQQLNNEFNNTSNASTVHSSGHVDNSRLDLKPEAVQRTMNQLEQDCEAMDLQNQNATTTCRYLPQRNSSKRDAGASPKLNNNIDEYDEPSDFLPTSVLINIASYLTMDEVEVLRIAMNMKWTEQSSQKKLNESETVGEEGKEVQLEEEICESANGSFIIDGLASLNNERKAERRVSELSETELIVERYCRRLSSFSTQSARLSSSSTNSVDIFRDSDDAPPNTNDINRGDSSSNRQQHVSSARSTTMSGLTDAEYEEFIARKMSSRENVGLTYSERQLIEQENAIIAVGDATNNSNGEGNATIGTHNSLSPAPEALDSEEEKVELESEGDVIYSAEVTLAQHHQYATQPGFENCAIPNGNDDPVQASLPGDNSPNLRSFSRAHSDRSFGRSRGNGEMGERRWSSTLNDVSEDGSATDLNDLPAGAHQEAIPEQASDRLGLDAEESARMLETVREFAGMINFQGLIEATLVEENEPMATAEATPVVDNDGASAEYRKRKIRLDLIKLLFIVMAITLAIILYYFVLDTDSSEPDNNAAMPEQVYEPTILTVKRDGVLRCGVPEVGWVGWNLLNFTTGESEGLSVDLCKAVAAGVMGPKFKIELIELTGATRFISLAERKIDILLWGDTHTMERTFFEPTSKTGFAFTDPYLYGGLGIGGRAPYVQCADDVKWMGACEELMICVLAVEVIQRSFPLKNALISPTREKLFQHFIDGNCDVIAGEQSDISEVSVRDAGYEGDYIIGNKTFSKEPLAMVTRAGDQSWTDVAQWVLQALIYAEMKNISQSNAEEFTSVASLNGNEGIDFVSAIKTVGNYGDIYERTFEQIVPRKGLNLLYMDAEGNRNGLIYSNPFGMVDVFGYDLSSTGKVKEILERGFLRCGMSETDEEVNTPSIGVDYCKALSASLFSSDFTLVEFVYLSDEDNWLESLNSGVVDLIINHPVSFGLDIFASDTAESGFTGFVFSQPYFYDTSHESGTQGVQGQKMKSRDKAIATGPDDPGWSKFVYWVVAASFMAEENKITKKDYMKMPEVKLLGINLEWMLRGSVLGIGNYGEIYSSHADTLPPRGGANTLHDGTSPLMHTHF